MALYHQVPIMGSPVATEQLVRQFTFDSHMPPKSGAPGVHSGCYQP